jgi:hypothetical protein
MKLWSDPGFGVLWSEGYFLQLQKSEPRSHALAIAPRPRSAGGPEKNTASSAMNRVKAAWV